MVNQNSRDSKNTCLIEVTAGIIFNDQNEVFIARRKSGSLAGFWEFPGGKIELNESCEKCLEREIKEELEVVIEVGSHFMTNEFEYPRQTVLLHSYFARIIQGKITLQSHDNAVWVSAANVSEFEFAPADVPIVNSLLRDWRYLGE